MSSKKGKRCAAIGCSSYGGMKWLQFFRFPKRNPESRDLWINALRPYHGSEWLPKPTSVLCSKHFVTGQQSKSRLDINYAPTLFSEETTQHDGTDVNVLTPSTKLLTPKKEQIKPKPVWEKYISQVPVTAADRSYLQRRGR